MHNNMNMDISRAVPGTQDMFRVYFNDVRLQMQLLQPWCFNLHSKLYPQIEKSRGVSIHTNLLFTGTSGRDIASYHARS